MSNKQHTTSNEQQTLSKKQQMTKKKQNKQATMKVATKNKEK